LRLILQLFLNLRQNEKKLAMINNMNKKENLQFILDCIEKWGNCSSIIALERDDCEIFANKDKSGIIIYYSTPKYNIVFGDPICAENNFHQTVLEFKSYCQTQNQKPIYLNVSSQNAKKLYEIENQAIIDFGDELNLNIEKDFKIMPGFYGNLLRRKYKAAEKSNLEIYEYKNDCPLMEKKLEEVAGIWLKNRKGIQTGVIPVNIFKNKINKRWFYAKTNDEIVGLLTLNKFNTNKFVINLLIHTPTSPPETSDFLVLKTIELLKAENIKDFCIGITPKKFLGQMLGFNKINEFLIKITYKINTKILKHENKQRFWKKFIPDFANVFIVLPDKRIKLGHITALLKAVKA
jgi:phosphatidylglycerol lysyltransferase